LDSNCDITQKSNCRLTYHSTSSRWLRASPTVLSMWLHTVKFIEKKSKCVSLEIGFSAPNSCSLEWLVKGATQLCTSKNECNKLDLTEAQYFYLVDYNDRSGGLLLVVPHVYAVSVWLVQLPKKQIAKRRHLSLLSKVTYWAPLQMLLWTQFLLPSLLPFWRCLGLDGWFSICVPAFAF
jgi:hypothetical protein